MSWLRWDGDDLILKLRVQPKASRDAFVGPYDENCYKVSITAPPVDGKANAHLRKWLARAFGVPRSSVILEKGETSRNKSVRIQSPKKQPAWPAAL